MSGHVGDLSEQQASILEQFRGRVKDVLKPNQGDHFLLRWLRARDFNVDKAEKMLHEALKWRQEMDADTILENYVEMEVLQKYRTGGLLPGRDKKGCPIYVDPYGLVDMKGLLRSCKKYDIMRKFVSVMETVNKLCEEETVRRGTLVDQLFIIYDLSKRGEHVDEMLLIYDLKGLGFRLLSRDCVDIYLNIVDAAESRYPETLRKVFVINSPRIFPIIWHIVKPWLHENTAKKVSVFSGNYREELLKEVDEDQLPECYGGTLKDPDGDPRCGTWICQGGMIPKEFYNQNSPTADMTTATVGRGSSLQLEYEVLKPGSLLRYEFHSEGFDIGFGVFRKTATERQKAGEMETLLTSKRTNSQLVPEDGVVECPVPGTYVVRFDNTYSWTRSKKVHYAIEILEPEKNNSEQDDNEEFFLAEETVNDTS